MKITICGYLRGYSIEKIALRTIQLYAEKILGDACSSIKEIRLVVSKKDISWHHGFTRLYNKKTKIAYVHLPGTYRNKVSARFLPKHELAHLKQIIEGRLVSRHVDKITFKHKRVGARTYHWNKKLYAYVYKNKSFAQLKTAWEKEANKAARIGRRL